MSHRSRFQLFTCAAWQLFLVAANIPLFLLSPGLYFILVRGQFRALLDGCQGCP